LTRFWITSGRGIKANPAFGIKVPFRQSRNPVRDGDAWGSNFMETFVREEPDEEEDEEDEQDEDNDEDDDEGYSE
jgi:hypothetical protein